MRTQKSFAKASRERPASKARSMYTSERSRTTIYIVQVSPEEIWLNFPDNLLKLGEEMVSLQFRECGEPSAGMYRLISITMHLLKLGSIVYFSWCNLQHDVNIHKELLRISKRSIENLKELWHRDTFFFYLGIIGEGDGGEVLLPHWTNLVSHHVTQKKGGIWLKVKWNSNFLENLLRNCILLPRRVERIANKLKHSQLETEPTSRGTPLFLLRMEQQEFPHHLCSFVWFPVSNQYWMADNI